MLRHVPFCPLFVAARATCAEAAAEYHDPTRAPGVRCIGSQCAYWLPVTRDRGVCGTVPNAPSWGDPAAPFVLTSDPSGAADDATGEGR